MFGHLKINRGLTLPGDADCRKVGSACKCFGRLGGERCAAAVDFLTLPDGTNYAASKKLDVAAKKIIVAITTKNFQKLAQ